MSAWHYQCRVLLASVTQYVHALAAWFTDAIEKLFTYRPFVYVFYRGAKLTAFNQLGITSAHAWHSVGLETRVYVSYAGPGKHHWFIENSLKLRNARNWQSRPAKSKTTPPSLRPIKGPVQILSSNQRSYRIFRQTYHAKIWDICFWVRRENSSC